MGSSEPILIYDVKNSQIADLNNSAKNLFGKFEEMKGRDIFEFLDQIGGKYNDIGELKQTTQSIRSSGHKTMEWVLDWDSTYIPLELFLIPLSTREGEFVAVKFVDKTSGEQTWEKLQEINRELERSNSELEQFAYVASHDLQEPLRILEGFSTILIEDYSDNLNDDAKYLIERILKAVSRMQSLIDALLNFAKVGKKDVLNPVDLNSVVDEILNSLEVRIRNTGAEVTVDELSIVKGHKSELKQVFQNLLSNSLKYRDDYPIINISEKSHEDMVEVIITDNGIGIEEQYLEKIFDIFMRLHAKDTYGGTGIGLAICKKIVESFGGKIWAVSENQGTSFHILLPFVKS